MMPLQDLFISPVLLDWSRGLPVPVIDESQVRGVLAEDDGGDPLGHLLPAVQSPTLLAPHLALPALPPHLIRKRS